MLHLALATNILTAIGAAPHFERPNFPILSRWYPPGVQIALVPFGERALRHFIYLERPCRRLDRRRQAARCRRGDCPMWAFSSLSGSSCSPPYVFLYFFLTQK